MKSDYLRPPIAPKMAKRAKNKATGNIPITVQAVSFASSQAVLPCPVGFAAEVTGQSMAVDTSENIRIPINSATAAPMNAKMNPIDSIK